MTEEKNQQYYYRLEKNIFSKETKQDFKAKFPNGRWLSCLHIYIQLKILGIRRGNVKSDYWFYSICADDFPEFINDTVYENTNLLREAGYILKVKDPGEKEFKQFPALELFYRENFVRRKNKSVCFYKVLSIKSKDKARLEKENETIPEAITKQIQDLYPMAFKCAKEKGFICETKDREYPLYDMCMTCFEADFWIKKDVPIVKLVPKIPSLEPDIKTEIKTDILEPETKPEIKKQSTGIKAEAWQQ